MFEAESWAEANFGDVRLGDRRRTRRAVAMAAELAVHSEKTLPRAFETWAELKAVYRFLSHPDVTHEAMIEPHRKRTAQSCREPGQYVLAADTTALDFTSHRAARGLGRIGDDGGRGLIAHTTLAIGLGGAAGDDPTRPRLIGLFDQRVWRRTEPARKGRERKKERLSRSRESSCWAQSLAGGEGPPAGTRWTFVADREADIYEVFAERLPDGVDMVIRAAQPRALANETGRSIFDAVAQAPVLGETTVPLRSRPGRPARQARLELRAANVRLRPPWRPDRKLAPIDIALVQAIESNPPQGETALKWTLLTSLPNRTFDQCQAVVQCYRLRWMIEEYHKALKSGTRIEATQLATVERIEALLGVLAVVAVRLLDAKLLARSEPDAPVDETLCPPPVQRVLEACFKRPETGWTNREFIRAVARLGGFLARKHDGEPGWQTIWRGWDVLFQRVQGFLIALKQSTYG